MNCFDSLVFKIATEPAEFEQIHRLNYRTFVEEIPQHSSNGDRQLVDKFHEENCYVVCLCRDRLVGMIKHRSRRPFSLDHKLPDLDSFLPPGRHLCEILLLTVEKQYRHSRVFVGLVSVLTEDLVRRGFDLALISGALLQQKLYLHLGFVPFGPTVGHAGAQFQPMYLTLEAFRERVGEVIATTAS